MHRAELCAFGPHWRPSSRTNLAPSARLGSGSSRFRPHLVLRASACKGVAGSEQNTGLNFTLSPAGVLITCCFCSPFSTGSVTTRCQALCRVGDGLSLAADRQKQMNPPTSVKPGAGSLESTWGVLPWAA